MLVDANDLLAHARSAAYSLAVLDVFDLASLDAALRAATDADAPLVLSVPGTAHELIAAAVAGADDAAVPVAVQAHVTSQADAERAIGWGCNSLAADASLAGSLGSLAAGSGVQVAAGAVPTLLRDAADQFFAAAQRSGYTAFRAGLTAALAATAESILRRAGAGRAAAAASCRTWSPVQHCIFYNSSAGEDEVRRMARLGTEVLAEVPGVLGVFAGKATTGDAPFRYCWLVRFAHERVIASYRHHPLHVEFADREFRPRAADRISIDFAALR